jgi:hypothetical protein
MGYKFQKIKEPQNLISRNPKPNTVNTEVSQLVIPNHLDMPDTPVLGEAPNTAENPHIIGLGNELPVQGVPQPSGAWWVYKFNIELKKDVYGCKRAREVLDEEFEEFDILNLNYRVFFDMHDRFFYSLSEKLHDYFLAESIKYLGMFTNPRDIEIQNLEKELEMVQEEIDSIERKHPYIPNGKCIAPKSFQNNPGLAIEQGNVYYVQSKKRRPIKVPEIYNGLKNRRSDSIGTDQQILDKDFIIFLDDITILNIGPEINNFNDIYTPPEDSNTDNIILYINKFTS